MKTVQIADGVLFFYGVTGRGLTLHAEELMVTLDLADTGSFSIPSSPYKAGDLADISGTLAGSTLNNGPAYYQGTSHPKLWYEGSLVIRATPFTIPPDSSQPVSVRTPFTFEGNLKAYKSNNISGGGGPSVFDVPLHGNGMATATFSASYNSGASMLVRDIRAWFYSFSNHQHAHKI